MFKKAYNWFYKFTSASEDRGEYAGGYFQGLIRKESLALCKDIKGRILEIGCGSGLFAMKLAEQNKDSEVFSIDNDREKLNYVEKKAKEKNLNSIKLLLQDATQLSFDRESFDAVVCINFLLMMDSLETVKRVLGQMSGVCKRQGRIIFEFRNSRNLFFVAKYRLARYYDQTLKNNPLNCYDPKRIEEILNGLNLKVTRKKYLFSFFFKSFAPIIIIEAQKNDQ